MKTIELIEKIKERPALYISRRSIVTLKSFIDGYTFCLQELEGKEPQKGDFFYKFQQWIAIRYNVKLAQSWSNIILFHSMDEYDALENFFELYDIFKKEMEEQQTL